MTASTTLNETELLSLLRQLGNFGPNKEGLTNVLKLGYKLDSKMLEDFASGKTSSTNSGEQVAISIGIKPLFNTTKSKMKFAQADRVLLDGLSKPYSDFPWSRLPVVNTNHSFLSISGQMVEGDAIGNMLYGIFDDTLKTYPTIKCRENVNVTATKLLIALKIYKMRHGKLPASLADLVPEELSQVPMDDFDGKAFRYAPEQKLIYSVGPDLKDDGGTGFRKTSKDYDIPFKIEF
ncbi:MAG TPA: hypothetical protein VFY06_13400 [Verrucomicrobiae bacterium]|nr:hypothetical protein [Verrucomicrobiae bacterium]